jgi:NADPH2:quinone reductase
MKALLAREYGPLEHLEIAEIAVPVPGRGEVRLRTEAVSINGIEPKIIAGALRDFIPIPMPYVPGIDVAGVVDEVGPGVTRLAPGDRVIASLGSLSGGVAEFSIARDDDRIAHRPAALTAVDGAALPTGALTARTVLEAAAVQPGETVLVIGATGGVGVFTVQAAHRVAKRVYATGRPEHDALLKSLGADERIDRDADPTGLGVDVVLDFVRSGADLAASAAAARPGGRLVSALGGPPAFDREVTATYIVTAFPPGALAEAAAQAADGRLIVPVGARYPFADAVRAYTDFTTAHLPGKLVITL